MQFLKAKLLQYKTQLTVAGIFLLLLCALLLLWFGKSNSVQSVGAVAVQVYFEGEYRIGDEPWQTIEKEKHIPSTQGDVTLRGNFHMLAPDGEYIGLFLSKTPLAFYTDHINLTFYDDTEQPYVIDHENPLFGASACGVDWTAHSFSCDGTKPITIVVHNPHRFGNETAIDEMLANVAVWGHMDFEKDVLSRGEPQRDIGLLFVLVSFVLLGTALFSTLIHIKNSNIIWLFGLVILFAGAYFMYSAAGVSFWRDSVVANTTVLGCSMLFYMLFLCMAVVYFLKSTKKAGVCTVAALCVADAVFLVLPTVTGIFFYDIWFCWASVQTAAALVLLVCLIKEIFLTKGKAVAHAAAQV